MFGLVSAPKKRVALKVKRRPQALRVIPSFRKEKDDSMVLRSVEPHVIRVLLCHGHRRQLVQLPTLSVLTGIRGQMEWQSEVRGRQMDAAQKFLPDEVERSLLRLAPEECRRLSLENGSHGLRYHREILNVLPGNDEQTKDSS